MAKIKNKKPAGVKKTRYHYVLFSADSPFKGRAEKNRKAYSRKQKHKKRDEV